MKKFKINFASNKGIRLKNDDACWAGVNKKHYFFGICCDGISSMPNSSKLANTIVNNLKESFDKTSYFFNPNGWINQVIQISLKQLNVSSTIPAGTTLSALLIIRNKVYYWNIGDSRIYLVNNNSAQPITRDDNLFNALVDQGYNQKDIDMIKRHENLLALTKCIDNVSRFNKLKFKKVKFSKDAVLLMLTDGIYNFVNEKQIVQSIKQNKDLIDVALHNGSNDNLSYVIVRREND